ncbi:hypothetical protein TWF281_008509 [Arthrobotrys megalospora]
MTSTNLAIAEASSAALTPRKRRVKADKTSYMSLPAEIRQNIVKIVLIDAIIQIRHQSRQLTTEHLISKLTLTVEDYEYFTRRWIMNSEDICNYVDTFYHAEYETCSSYPNQEYLERNHCRCPAVITLCPIPVDLLLVSRQFRTDAIAMYPYAKKAAPGIIQANKIPPNTFRDRYEPVPALEQKCYDMFSRDLIFCSLFPPSHAC